MSSTTPSVRKRENASARQVEVQAAGDEIAPVNGHAAGPAVTKESDAAPPSSLAGGDVRAIVLLVILYLLQGIPVGLAFGTMPYLLKSKLSYAEIGTFALSTYPYSLKLAWSPIVDSCWVPSLTLPFIGRVGLGRRKSWIVPVQLIVGAILWSLSRNVDGLLLADKPPVNLITALFFILVLFAATQDIAVDGWALTLLSQENLSYASTAQTVGLNIGYFMSFTVFLALNSVEFSNKYLRTGEGLDYPVLSLSAYLKVASVAFVAVTLWLALVQDEGAEKPSDGEPSMEDEMGLRGAYEVMWKICKLKHVQTFLLIHLVAKIGFQANEAVTGLKLVEKGFSKEDLALTVLIDFPFQIVLGYLAARWSRGDRALTPWLWGYVARLGMAVVSMGIVGGLSTRAGEGGSGIGLGYFALIILSTVAGSFASTVQFVGISAFHTQIADPLIGGTYMTLLNTVSNLGGTWPRYFVLKAVDAWTVSECRVPADIAREAAAGGKGSGVGGGIGAGGSVPPDVVRAAAGSSEALLEQLGKAARHASGSKPAYVVLPAASSCATSDTARSACLASSGACVTTRDGYYATSTACVVIGVVLLFVLILPQGLKLQRMGVEQWRVTKGSGEEVKGKEGEKKKLKKEK